MHILWLKTELLHPVDKGGKIRTYQMLRHLKAAHHVTYLSLDDGSAAPDAKALALEYCHDVVTVPFSAPPKGSAAFFAELARNAFSALPYAVSRYRSPAMREAIRRVVREQKVDLVVCDFLVPSINIPADLGVPVLLFQHNVEAAIWERHALVAANPIRKAYMREQWRRMRAYEREVCRTVDHVVAVSEADRAAFETAYGVTSPSAVATGVDTDYFRPLPGEPRRPREIVFTGSMDWMPNEDGIGWFVRDIFPLVEREVPGVHLSIVGRNPTALVRSLAAESVTVTGTVPDIRPFLQRAAVVVVPLRVGGGTRLKIYEAMAMECAIVSTTIGAEGLPVADGRDIRIADTPASFAAAILDLLRVPDDARRMGEASAALVRQRFGWESVSAEFTAACEATVQRWQSRAGGRAHAGRAA